MDVWYFAYGSNLSRPQMTRRVGLSPDVPTIRATLPGYRLAFNMGWGDEVFANIVEPGPGVVGVLYPCTPEMMRILDTFEEGYDRREVQVIDESGTSWTAIAYIARPENVVAEGTPSEEYLRLIQLGSEEQGMN
jgi:gamma-glutamylcyclotransferase (GGCT)/AIG2-like uncharacterized protein YtfP